MIYLPNPEAEFVESFSLEKIETYRTRIWDAGVAHLSLDRGLMALFMRRLDILKEKAEIENSRLTAHRRRLRRHIITTLKRRYRRGLLNAGGWILKTLLGVATGKDIKEVRQLIAEAANDRGRIHHKVDQLVSRVNQLSEAENRTREYLQEQRLVLTQLQMDVAEIRKIANRTHVGVLRNRKAIILQAYLSALEEQFGIRKRALEAYRLQRRDLEKAELTEEILPEDDLKDILRLAGERGYDAVTTTWYYEHCRVRPLWDDPTALSYIVEIPLIKGTTQGFQLRTFPHFNANLSEWVNLVVNEYVGYNEETGQMVILEACRGHNPAVCQLDLVFRAGLPCERALILGVKEGAEKCKVHARAPPEPATTTIGLNLHVVESMDEQIEIRCLGQPTNRTRIPPGSRTVRFDEEGCQIQGESGWVLEGLEVFDSEMEIHPSMVDTSEIEFPELPNVDFIQPAKISQLHQVKGVAYEQLQMLRPAAKHDLLKPTHSTANTYAIIALIFVAAVILVIYLYCRYGQTGQVKRWRRAIGNFRRDVKTSKPDGAEQTVRYRNSNANGDGEVNLGYFGHVVDPDGVVMALNKMRNRYPGNNPLIPSSPLDPEIGKETTDHPPKTQEDCLSTVSMPT